MNKIVFFVGNYGSGKTELSLAAAFGAAARGLSTVLVDYDIVNPYFRASERTAALTAAGVRVIAPCFANTGVDIPSLPPEIYAPFDSDYDFTVYDAGGDPVGATAIGLLQKRIAERRADVELIFVVNARRPFQSNAGELCETLRTIEARCGVSVDSILNNTNLAAETTPAMLAEGAAICRELSRQTAIPFRYTAHTLSVAPPDDGTERILIERRMGLEW